MENLEELDLTGTGIKEIPSSIDSLVGLKSLYLSKCGNLENRVILGCVFDIQETKFFSGLLINSWDLQYMSTFLLFGIIPAS
ncbi:LRR domain containing protein [Parasponia andersonii]|uniref:LRR domain containing protein n=1 Tax=Parasponia andersonii TaxID=3476 RepID=A0A2P5DRM7_PARAD|nr:LRR domain containing protein [Parasponia andersonii]